MVSLGLGFITSIILARTLGVKVFGQYSFIMSLVPLLALPIAAGVPQLLTREIAGYVKEKQWGLFRGIIKSAYKWVFFVSAVLFVLYLVAKLFNWVPETGRWAVFPYALVLVLLSGLNRVRMGIMRGLKAPFLASLPEMLVLPVLLLLFMVMLLGLDNLNLHTAMTAQICAATVSFIAAAYLLLKVFPQNVKSEKTEQENQKWLLALLPFTLIQAISVFNINMGTVLVGLMSHDAEVSAMRVAERISQLISLPLLITNLVIAPHIVDAWKNQDKKRLQQLARKSAKANCVLSLPIALPFIFWGQELISLVYGADFSIAAQPLMVLTIAQLFNVFCGSVGMLMMMSGHEKYTLRAQIVAVIFNIVISVVLIPFWGSTGAAIGVALGLVIWNVLLSLSVRKHLKIRPSAI